MSDRLLTSILELEKRLQGEVARETARAGAWRERELAALAGSAATAQQQLERWGDEQASAARRTAEAEGEQLKAAAAARGARLAAVSESFLEELLRERLAMLLPEDGHDHPDGKS